MWQMVAFMAAKALLQTNTEIKVAKSQNKAAMSQLGKQINQINLQRAQSQQQTNQALFNIDVATQGAQSQIQLQSAASGTMGASVQDAVSTVNLVRDRQDAGVYAKAAGQAEAYRLATSGAIEQTHNSMDWESGTDKLWNNVLAGAGGLAGQYLGNALSSSTQAGISAAEGTSSVTGDVQTASTQNYGYDLWGRQGSSEGAVSWKSYLDK